jgi:light-regulated signal transduction histidine kinase (bacteriophytochrome)
LEIHRLDGQLRVLSEATRAFAEATVDYCAASQLAAAEPERSVNVVVEDGLAADLDPGLARALVDNLVGNAWKFTRGKASARVEVGTAEGSGGHEFFVRDNGAGFDMAFANKLFAPFQRLHTVHEFPGTGIGWAGGVGA